MSQSLNKQIMEVMPLISVCESPSELEANLFFPPNTLTMMSIPIVPCSLT